MESCHDLLLWNIFDELTDHCFFQSRNGHHLLSSARHQLQQLDLQDRESEAFLRRNELRACIALLFQTLPGFNSQWGVKSVPSGICHWLGYESVLCSRDVECESCVSLGSIGGHCHLLSPLPEMTVQLSTLEKSFFSCCHNFLFLDSYFQVF